MFVFGDFDAHHKKGLTYSNLTDRSVELYFKFSLNFLITLLRWLTLLLWLLTLNLTVLFSQSMVAFSSNGAFWSSDCLSFNWRSFKLKRQWPFSSYSLWLFWCWFRQSLQSSERSLSLIHLHGFSVACAAAMAHENHFFCLYQQNESSGSKVKLGKGKKCFWICQTFLSS